MKTYLITITAASVLCFSSLSFSNIALAEHSTSATNVEERLDRKGDRIGRRLDHRGDRIDRRPVTR